MSTSKLDMVLRLVIEEEKQAALNFKAVHEDYVSTEDALNQALGYRVEYEELSRGLRPSKFPLLQLRAARSFLSSIDSLIESQRRILLEKHDALEVRRKQWYLLRAKTKSIEAVIASRNKSRLIMEEKKEQIRLDDLFGRETLP
jgi:flagellar export protein FliJ